MVAVVIAWDRHCGSRVHPGEVDHGQGKIHVESGRGIHCMQEILKGIVLYGGCGLLKVPSSHDLDGLEGMNGER